MCCQTPFLGYSDESTYNCTYIRTNSYGRIIESATQKSWSQTASPVAPERSSDGMGQPYPGATNRHRPKAPFSQKRKTPGHRAGYESDVKFLRADIVKSSSLNPTVKDIRYVEGVLVNLHIPDAEDVAGSAWLWAWEHRTRFDPAKPGKLANWVIKIALGLRMNERRAEESRMNREYRWYLDRSKLEP